MVKQANDYITTLLNEFLELKENKLRNILTNFTSMLTPMKQIFIELIDS